MMHFGLASEKTIGKEGRFRRGIRMVNWLKVAGIALMVLGILTFFVGLTVVMVYSEPSEELPYEPFAGPPWWVSPVGIVMIAVGAYLHYLGGKKGV
jgi:amino acid transporter